MDCTTTIGDLRAALTLTNRTIRRGALPALSGVRIEATDAGLRLVASDLDTTVLTNAPAHVSRPGTALVPAKLLASLLGTANIKKDRAPIRLLAEDTVNITVVNGITTELRCLPLDEFLSHPDTKVDAPVIDLDPAEITEVCLAASTDDTRPVLCGVYFAPNGEICGTDSYRLHLVRTNRPQVEALVHAGALRQVLASKPSGSIGMQVFGDNVYLSSGGTVWVTRAMEGEFPNYRQLIPNDFPYNVTVDRAGLISLVEAVKVMAREAAPVRLTFEDDTLTVTAICHDVGKSSGSMASSGYIGPPTTIGFNPEFLIATAKAGRGNTVTVGFLDPLRPAALYEQRGDRTSVRLLMPCRLG